MSGEKKTALECMFADLSSDYTKEQLLVRALKAEAENKKLRAEIEALNKSIKIMAGAPNGAGMGR